jgi:hypothetical protein
MSEHHDNFNKWFREPLDRLYGDEHAGFAILMISLPLLERYLRQKSGVCESPSVDSRFHDGLAKMFTSLERKTAEKFWKIYRHGLLHQATLKTEDGILEVGVHNDTSPTILVSKIPEGLKFSVSPVSFSKKVIEEIESNFETFMAEGSPNHPPAKVDPLTGRSGWPGSR